MDSYVQIGRIVATFGFKGELIIQHAMGEKPNLKKIDAFFIEERRETYLPFFIESYSIKETDSIIVQLEGVTSKEQAQKLTRKNVWLLEDVFRKVVKQNAPISLIGFSVINEEIEIGVVEEVIQQPHQVLLKITYKNNEALIPLHAETLNQINQEQKKVFVTLPDGLLELYE